MRSQATRLRWAGLLLAVTWALAVPATASAGTLTLRGPCGSWGGNSNHWDVVVFATPCPQMRLDHRNGSNWSPPGYEGNIVFNALPGTTISTFGVSGVLHALDGWQASMFTSRSGPYEE